MKTDLIDENIAKEQLSADGILKEERVMYLRSKVFALQGTLYLTAKRLVLIAHKTTVGHGILGILLKAIVAKKKYGFNLELHAIKRVAQTTHGLQKSVLEVTDDQESAFRIVVKDCREWEAEIDKAR